ncbi:hypothetical protein LP420_38895 [Massilia sp. B-10]|nr:hypothetical protein LP420_38895 [Massilia sp. B-10]
MSKLRLYRRQIGLLAVFGTVASTALVGSLLYLVLPYLKLVAVAHLLHAVRRPHFAHRSDCRHGHSGSRRAPESLELVIA